MLANLMIAIKDWHRVLPEELNTAERKFNGERLFIHGFKKTGSQLTMHTNRSGNDLLRDFRISETLSRFPAFLRHKLNDSFRAGFFPAGVVGHRNAGNRLFFD